jgi:hypothetical protein
MSTAPGSRSLAWTMIALAFLMSILAIIISTR